MRWDKKKRPVEGERRIKRKFLWFPKCLKGQYRWMETAEWVVEAYYRDWGLYWRPIAWVDSEDGIELMLHKK
jgi:hypothetical protein